ncbi:pre-mrna polyadenylation factor fip1 [Moniliophthora roreri MCA 2997]|uniref:Pre-mrna polyadenylation factor fip1 n=1 Tax=Moniliophthora roreri (strain MCA 2997) TaxID=1381753 RepID=V2YX40_MONRO|nr:pre-mrna polyadenylation factor fip1 [Moniliophthora roreri MCA 2997]
MYVALYKPISVKDFSDLEHCRDDEDEFLYGLSSNQEQGQPQGRSQSATSSASVSQPKPVENTLVTNGIVSQLEAAAENQIARQQAQSEQQQEFDQDEQQNDGIAQEDGSEEGAVEGGGESEEDEEEDIEIIMEATPRSIDFRQNAQGRPPQNRTASATQPTHTPVKAPQPTLTTEYTPIQRGVVATPSKIPQLPTAAPAQPISSTTGVPVDESSNVDPSTLPPAVAPPSHPKIDPNETGMLDGRSIFEVDISAMSEKPWRRPGSDISDWFNYGFDEISWEAYCYRRREMGEVAGVMKVNVLNFAGMQEDQLTALPPEVRQMVMTGTSAMMNQMNQINQAVAGAGNNGMGDMGMNPAMMPPGMMMDMSGNMGMMNHPMAGMGMNGDMGMGQMGGGMPMDGQAQGGMPGGGMGGPVPGSATPEQVAGMGMMQDAGFPGAMGMGMEFGIQDQNQIFQGMDQGQTVPPSAPGGAATPVPGATRPGVQTPQSFAGRGRGVVPGPGVRGRGFPVRGRGRGMYGGVEGAPTAPARPASPLPPNVPTGPRNQNKYKDRDGNAPAVDGLDYGGERERERDPRDPRADRDRDRDRREKTRTPSREPDDRASRKRRSSPGLDDGRSSKRR